MRFQQSFSPAALRAQAPAVMRAVRKIVKAITPSRPSRQTPRALLVGGFVRDLLLKQRPKDADVEIYGVNERALERALKKAFPKRVNAIGKTFGVFKIRIGTDSELDVSLPRRDSKTAKGHKGFSVTGDPRMDVREAARRRDFTMNAFFLDPTTGELIDPCGGMADLKARMLRAVDANTFGEDPLRVWRAVQFAARFAMEPEPKTTKLLRDMVKRGDTDELPKERVTEELRKLLLRAERPSIGFELARMIGLTERDIPELHALVKAVQNAGAHREGTAWAHTMLVVDAMAGIIREPRWKFSDEEKLVLMLASFCHDLGKAHSTWRRVQNIPLGYVNHPKAGVEPATALLARFSFGGSVNTCVIKLTEHHRRGGNILDRIRNREDERAIANELRKLIRDIRPATWKTYLAMSKADTLGVSGWNAKRQARDIVTKLDRVVQRHGLVAASRKTLLAGTDLLRLGLAPGPRIGDLINEVERARDDGRVATKAEAIRLAKTLVRMKDGS